MIARRRFLSSTLAGVAASAGLWGRSWAQTNGAATYDAHIGPIPDSLRANAGKAFDSLNAALAATPDNDSPYRILLGKVSLFEKVTIHRPRVAITGLSPEVSQLTFDDYSGRSDGQGATLGTRRTGTLTITAPHVALSNLSLINSFDYLGQMALAADDPKKVHDTQALALAVSGSADQVRLENVVLSGYQDTLFIDSGRALLTNCHVSGSVDFIFGAGTVALDHCRITSRLMPGKPGQGYVCAPSTLKSTTYGFVFFDCTLDHEGQPFPDDSVALARPWRPTTTFPDGRYGNPDVQSACLYLRCAFGNHIAAKGFDHMSYNAKDGTKAFNEPRDARFYIADCTGHAATAIPANFMAPKALTDGLNPANLLDLAHWTL